MNTSPKSRHQKLVDVLFPFFGDMDADVAEDAYALRVCHHLLALKTQAIDSDIVLDFIDIWNSQHPEENSLTNNEFVWGLLKFDEVMSQRMHDRQVAYTQANSTRAKLRVINGGLHENPDRPYVDEESILRKYDMSFMDD